MGGQNLATGPGASTLAFDSPLSGDSEVSRGPSRAGNLFRALAPGLAKPKSTARGELGPHRAPALHPN